MPAALTKVVTLVVHEGGDLRLSLRLTSGADAAIVISDVRLTSEPAPADPQ
jgi:hypothetical protein